MSSLRAGKRQLVVSAAVGVGDSSSASRGGWVSPTARTHNDGALLLQALHQRVVCCCNVVPAGDTALHNTPAWGRDTSSMVALLHSRCVLPRATHHLVVRAAAHPPSSSRTHECERQPLDSGHVLDSHRQTCSHQGNGAAVGRSQGVPQAATGSSHAPHHTHQTGSRKAAGQGSPLPSCSAPAGARAPST